MDKMNLKSYVKKEKEIMDKEYELISELVKIREDLNLTQKEVGKSANINQPSIARFEKGTHSPQLNTLLKVLSVYGYTVEFVKTNK